MRPLWENLGEDEVIPGIPEIAEHPLSKTKVYSLFVRIMNGMMVIAIYFGAACRNITHYDIHISVSDYPGHGDWSCISIRTRTLTLILLGRAGRYTG
jgi:hypothetical protein